MRNIAVIQMVRYLQSDFEKGSLLPGLTRQQGTDALVAGRETGVEMV